MKEAVKKWNICARFMVQAFCKENSEQKATELTAYKKIAEFSEVKIQKYGADIRL